MPVAWVIAPDYFSGASISNSGEVAMRFPRTDSTNAHSQGEIGCNVQGTGLNLGLRGWLDIGSILARKFSRGATMSQREMRSRTAIRRILGLILGVISCVISTH